MAKSEFGVTARVHLDDRYSHLTNEQRETILGEAISARIQSCLESTEYLINVVRDLAMLDDVDALLDSISGDPTMCNEILGFDPETGDPFDEDKIY